MRPFLGNSPRTRVLISLLSMACGGAIVGLCSPIVITNVEFFYGFALAFTEGGGNAQFTASATAILAAAAGGGILLISGLFGLAGHFARSNFLLISYLILTLIGSLVAVVGGGLFMSVPSMVGERIYIDDTNSIDPPLQGLEKDMNDFQLSVFNECCVPRNWTEQRAALPCTGDNNVDCPAIINPLVTDNIPNARILLCSCASSNTSIDNFRAAIRNTNFCNKARKAFINAVDIRFPNKVPGNLKLATLVEQRHPGETLRLAKVPLVGFPRTSGENPDQSEVAEFPESFGCGLGYQKGIAWMTDLWFQQNVSMPAVGALAFGLINIFFIIAAITITAMQNAEEKEYMSGKVDKWDNLKDIPAGYAQTGNPLHVPPMMVPYAGSAHNSVVNSVQLQSQTSHHSTDSQKAIIFEQLRDFYAKYDKEKNLSDVQDVATWGSINGIDALNAKLMSKYNADLNSVSRGGSAGAGLGSKALKEDLDI